MSDETTKGHRAKQMLEDDVFIEAETMARAAVLKRWQAEEDKEKREELWMELQGLGATRRALQTLADRGTKKAHDRARQEQRLDA